MGHTNHEQTQNSDEKTGSISHPYQRNHKTLSSTTNYPIRNH